MNGANIEKIKRLNPDVAGILEVLDIRDAAYLSSKLPEYPFIIPVAGVSGIGPSSMMYIVSKYEIVEDSIEFIPFEKETELTGRAKYSEKGIEKELRDVAIGAMSRPRLRDSRFYHSLKKSFKGFLEPIS